MNLADLRTQGGNSYCYSPADADPENSGDAQTSTDATTPAVASALQPLHIL
jgi:hypothetical protein